MRIALLDTETAWRKVSSLFQASQDQLRDLGRPRMMRRNRRSGPSLTLGQPPRPPVATADSSAGVNRPGQGTDYPWQWSAEVLAGLAALSLWLLATRVRSLDRLR
jgi:hypothetical protein